MAAIDDLKHHLNEDIRQLDNLADVLSQEKQVLKSSDVRALHPLTEEKNALLSDIRERARQKIHVLVAMGYRPEHGEPSRFIQSAGMSDLLYLWHQADQRLKQCQKLNQSNGRIISHLQKRLTRLTDIFRGAAGQQQLYGAKGEQTTVSSRSILASA